MTIAVDFDGTIVEHRYPEIGAPIPFAIETLRLLVLDGHKLILWTVREGALLDEAVQYLIDNDIDLYAVNSDYPNSSWSDKGVSRKITADVYIDDRNLGGLPDWGQIYQIISNRTIPERHAKSHSNTLWHFMQKLKERCQASRRRLNQE